MLERINACLIIPTYNNARTLERVLKEVMNYARHDEIIVVNDGSTDATAGILARYKGKIIPLENPRNSGKGAALRRGFEEAARRGFTYALTMDSDGQHLASDIPAFVETALQHPGALLMGSRDMTQEGVPGKSAFGNRFSSFWFWVHTGIRLPDTQTGFRLYPLEPLRRIRLITSKFETEIEVIVKMAWRGVAFVSVPIRVIYDPGERVTHFRPFKDFSRISVLNTWFFILTLLWYLPKRLLEGVMRRGFRNTLKAELFKAGESNLTKAFSVGFGVFMGIVPVWGFQLLIAMSAAVFFRLNKVLVFLAAHISIPPMIPLIIFASFRVGSIFFRENGVQPVSWKNLTLDSIHLHLMQYVTGAVLLAFLLGLGSFLISLVLLSVFKNRVPRSS